MIRKIYLDMVRGKLARGNLPWLARTGSRYLMIHLSRVAGRPLCGPILGTLIVTYRCNYDCVMCDMPSRGKSAAELDTAGMIGIVDQLASIGTMGVGFTGGEPMLRSDIMELLEHSKKTGMLTHLNTNGSLLDAASITDLIDLGLDSLNISLDAATASVHDSMRGVPGAWDKATWAASEVVRLREKGKGKPRLKLVMVAGPDNVDEIPAMVDLAHDLGVECLEYIPEQPFREAREKEVREEMGDLADQAAALLKDAVKSARGRVKIENSPRMLALFGATLRGELSPLNCYAGYNSMTIDCYGQVFPCLPWANWDRSPESIGNGGLEDLWNSERYTDVREEAARCRACTLNCQSELNLLFQPFKRIRAG